MLTSPAWRQPMVSSGGGADFVDGGALDRGLLAVGFLAIRKNSSLVSSDRQRDSEAPSRLSGAHDLLILRCVKRRRIVVIGAVDQLDRHRDQVVVLSVHHVD